jgi:endonuclease YncB( thermonuclease family)
MIQEGYAFEYTYKKPYKFQTEFKQSEKEAQDKDLGLWNNEVCNY